MLHFHSNNQLILIAEAATARKAAPDELIVVVLAAAALAAGVLSCLIRQYRRTVLENRVQAVRELEERYRDCKSRAESVLARAKSEGRDFNAFESREFTRLMDEYDEVQTELKQARMRVPAPETHQELPQLQARPTSAVEGLLFLQLLTMLGPWDRDQHSRR